MRRTFDRIISGPSVVFDPAPVETLVRANLVMYEIVRCERRLHVHDGGQFLDVGLDGFYRITRLFFRLGNDRGIGIAHMTDLAVGQHGTLGLLHRLAIAAVDKPACGVAANIGEIGTGKNRQHAGHAFRNGCVD